MLFQFDLIQLKRMEQGHLLLRATRHWNQYRNTQLEGRTMGHGVPC